MKSFARLLIAASLAVVFAAPAGAAGGTVTGATWVGSVWPG